MNDGGLNAAFFHHVFTLCIKLGLYGYYSTIYYHFVPFCYFFRRLHYGNPMFFVSLPTNHLCYASHRLRHKHGEFFLLCLSVILLLFSPQVTLWQTPASSLCPNSHFSCYFPQRLHYGKPPRVHLRLPVILLLFSSQVTLWQTAASFSPLSPFQ